MKTFENIYLDLITEENEQGEIDTAISTCENLVNAVLENPKDKSNISQLISFFNSSDLIEDLKKEGEVSNEDFGECFSTDANEDSDDDMAERYGISEEQLKNIEKEIAKRIAAKSKKNGKSKIAKLCKNAKAAAKIAKLIFYATVAGVLIYGYKNFGTRSVKDVANDIDSYIESYDKDSASTLEQLKGVYLGAEGAATGIRQPAESIKYTSEKAVEKHNEEDEAEGKKPYDSKEHGAIGNFFHGMTHPTEILGHKK